MGKVQIRPKILLFASVLVAAACALMIPRVNVNTDMTRYLPDDSAMKRGLDILSGEFGQSASAAVADVRIMMEGTEGMDAVRDSLAVTAGVDAVTMSTGNGHTLFELNVSKSVNQKRLAKRIKNSYPYNCVTQTSQDGNTPAAEAIVLAVICLVVILLILSRSFLEPVLFLISTGLAVAVNMGTNAFLPSVSVTTHSIAGILQLALSMDYSIILMNRYRQQLRKGTEKYEAMAAACRKAAPAILSSSLTTVVGLLMLSFMRLKIGLDLGFVLAKGVLCSLIYSYTALPGLILLCQKGIEKTAKKVPVPNTDRLSAFCHKFRIPLTAAFVLIFIVSIHFSLRTPITFSTSTPSAIDEVFPKKNAVVLIYDNDKEDSVVPILDSAALDKHVESIFSYPTLMKKKLTAEAMTDFLKGMAGGNENADMLSPELLRLCYYAKYGDNDLRIGFTELVDFISTLEGNPLLAKIDIPDLDQKLGMLKDIREMAALSSAQGESRIYGPLAEEDGKMTVREYMRRLNAQQNNADTRMLLSLTDPAALKRKMSVEEMTAYMGSTPMQTKMVYSFSSSGKEGMTPLQFAHFLTDDLFNRKALAKMVSKEQKNGMTARTRIMDAAASGAEYGKEELDAFVIAYGLKEVLREESVREEPAVTEPAVTEPAGTEPVSGTGKESTEPVQATMRETVPETPAEQVQEQVGTAAAVEDPRMVLLERMLQPGRRYSARAMSRNFRALGENVDESMLSMLYSYYGSVKFYDPAWTMDLEELASIITEKFGYELDGLDDGVSALRGPRHSIAAIITDYPDESPETEAFVRSLKGDHSLVGESVMLCEMKDGFGREQRLVTILTILAIFLIVAITFRSPLTAAILVMTVMTSVFINVASCGIGGGSELYLAYLIVQSILMGATIDYGILFSSFYRENRDLKEAYRGSIHTILTSGLIISCVPGAMALLLDDAMIQPIVKNLAIGSFSAIILILFFLPGVLSLVFPKKK